MKILYKILVFNLLCCITYSQKPNYGLEFSSFEVTQEKRTGLNLTSEKPLELSEGFTLSFDMYYPSIYELQST
jgi:hypothetical protein